MHKKPPLSALIATICVAQAFIVLPAVSSEGVPPQIVAQPASQGIYYFGSVTFSVNASGEPPPAFQWQFNGVPIVGATNATLTLSNVTYQQDGSYSVVASNSYGQIASTTALLRVYTQPIFAHPADQTPTLGELARFEIRAEGISPTNYQWQFNGVDIPGATFSVLTITNARPLDVGGYRVTLLGRGGYLTSQEARLSLVPANPVRFSGRSLTFDAGNTREVVVSFQWRRSEHNVSGATNSTLTLASPQIADSGDYSVVVQFPTGAVVYAVARLTVLPRPPPGRVIAWGANNFGQTNLPADSCDTIAIAAGDNFGLGLKADGTLFGWGYPYCGATSIPESVKEVVGVAAGPNYSMALREDGTVAVWGNCSCTACFFPILRNVVGISPGAYALKNDGTVEFWAGPPVPNGLTGVVAVAAGTEHGLALKNDGTVVAWGNNIRGEASVPNG